MNNSKTKVINSSNEQTYILAKFWKIIFTRFFDFLLVSIIIFFFSWILYKENNLTFLTKTLLNYVITFLLLILYFIIIPYFFSSRTLFKYFFKINLVQKNCKRISLYHLFFREIFITFIPWAILVINNLIFSFIISDAISYNVSDLFFNNIESSKLPIFLIITIRFSTLIYIIWYLILIILLKLDKEYQLFFDRYLLIFIVKNKKNLYKKNKKSLVYKKQLGHIHLHQNLPAVIDNQKLEENENL